MVRGRHREGFWYSAERLYKMKRRWFWQELRRNMNLIAEVLRGR